MKFLISSFLLFVSTFLPHTLNAADKSIETATFAGGCFWCTQKDFDQVDGVISTVAGFTGGRLKDPTYNDVASGTTGHVEAVQVVYDPSVVTYDDLLRVYFYSIDPTDGNGQFCDRGAQYRPVIFYKGMKQKKAALAYKNELIATKDIGPIVVDILPVKKFYPAEESQQKYYEKHPFRYKFYRIRCGRDKRLKQVWGKS